MTYDPTGLNPDQWIRKSPPGKPGRPLGRKNSTPSQKKLQKATKSLFQDVEHMLTDEEKEYYQLAYNGKMELDPALEMQLFIRLFGLYVTRMMAEGLSNEALFRDMGGILGHYRGAIKDLEDMRVKRAEMKRKYKDDEVNESGVSDFTRQSAESRLEDILGGGSQGQT